MAVAMPGLDRLPPGPLRDLVQALHELYRDAGRPSARAISTAIRSRNDLRDTVSHETISATLRGDGPPGWAKVECIVRQLASWAVTRPDPNAEVRRFHGLWLSASEPAAESSAGRRTATTANLVEHPPAQVRQYVAPENAVESRHPQGARVGWRLPTRNVNFVGRETLIHALSSTLADSGRPVVLYGLGGTGKTQVAIEYAHRAGEWYDLVWWVSVEQPALARATLASLGEYLALPPSADMRQTVQAVLDALETSDLRWLLILDNADTPAAVAPLMPTGGGRVIVTSRNPTWPNAFDAIEIDLFDRNESVELLIGTGRDISREEADELAERLGDLPLAVEQVAAMQAATGLPVREYLRLFDEHLEQLLSQGRPSHYPKTVAAFLRLAFGRLRSDLPAAAQLLGLFAFLGPEPVSVALLRSGRDGDLSRPLSRILHEPAYLSRAVSMLRRYGLAKTDSGAQRIRVHRLFQLWLREAPGAEFCQQSRANVHNILAAANPGKPDDPRTWALHSEISLHVQQADLLGHEALAGPRVRQVVLDQVRYLFRRGEYAGSRDLAEQAVGHWSRPPEEGGLGADHEHTLLANRHLGNALRLVGQYKRAREIDEDTLVRLRRSSEFGEFHEHTVAVGFGLGVDLRLAGDLVQAHERDQENLERSRRTFGEDDSNTLIAKNNVAASLRMLGDYLAAYDIDAEVVGRWRSGYGDNHPRTLWAISNLARDLYGLGRYGDALEMQQRAWPAHSEQLGARHNEVLLAARTIAIALRKVGQYKEALDLAKENYDSYHARFGPDHEHTLATIMSHANTLRVVGRTDEALGLATEAVERYRRIFGERHPLTLAAEVNLAIILRTSGRHREARDTDVVTLRELQQVLPHDHPYTLCAASNLAIDLALAGEATAARALSTKTLDTSRRVRGERHPDTLACALNAALDERTAGYHSVGERQFAAASAALREVLGVDHPETLHAAQGFRVECDIEPPPT